MFVVHDTHGMSLLHCTRKKKKPAHYQLPGGHVDEPEFLQAAKQHKQQQSQLIEACTAGAARELYEETGLDFRSRLDRLEPARIRGNLDEDKGDNNFAVNEYKQRLFFFLQVKDKDFAKYSNGVALSVAPQSRQKNVQLKLSHEHSGFTFEPEPSRAAVLLKHHSWGKCSEAPLMAMKQDVTAMTSMQASSSSTSTTTPTNAETSQH
jgi:8-oxo-dGTP pyrophosphatase MutT (NUDIX family)